MNKKGKKTKTRLKVSPEPAHPAPARKTAITSTGKVRIRLCIFIGLFSFALYAQSIFFDYTYDDLAVIQGNFLVKQGFKAIPDLMTTDYWYGFTGNKKGAIYRPVSLIMFALEWKLFPGNPMPGHLLNVSLFAITCSLLFLVLSRLSKNGLLFAAICSLLYASHPIHTEVVNNIKSRDEILCFLFSVLALKFYMTYYSGKKLSGLLTGSVFFLLALLSKETAIAFLVLIPLTLFIFEQTNKRALVYVGLSLVVVTLAYFGLRQMISADQPIRAGIGITDNFMIAARSYAEVLASAIYVLFRYVVLLVFPHPLSADYSYAELSVKTFADPFVIFGTLVFAAGAIFSIILIRKKNLYAYGILFFLVSIFPVSNIPFLFGSSMAERFLYIPSFGFCLLLSLLLMKFARLTIAEPIRLNQEFFDKHKVLISLAALLTIAYTLKTIIRSRDWKDNLTLFSKAAKASSNSARAHYGYGSALFGSGLAGEGTPAEVSGKFELAKKEYEEAIAIFPQYSNAYMGIGFYYKNKNDFKNALKNFEAARALVLTPQTSLYKELGYAYLKTSQYHRSIAALDSFLLFDKPAANIYNFKGSALFGLQRFGEALAAYKQALALSPNDVEFLKNAGRCHISLKEYDKAASYFKQALELEPGNPENYQFLGMTYQLMGDLEKANPLLQQYQKMVMEGNKKQ